MKAEAPARCPACKRLKKRSNPANARYWLLLHLMSEGIKPEGMQHSPEVWHQWAKSKFLGMDEYRLPNGKLLQVPKSSAELDTQEFNEFMRQVEEFAMSRNVYMDTEPT